MQTLSSISQFYYLVIITTVEMSNKLHENIGKNQGVRVTGGTTQEANKLEENIIKLRYT